MRRSLQKEQYLQRMMADMSDMRKTEMEHQISTEHERARKREQQANMREHLQYQMFLQKQKAELK